MVITSKTYAGAYFFFIMSVILFRISNTPTPGLDILSSQTPIWMRMFTLAEASVWEEISGRVVLIGVPLAVVSLLKDKRPSALMNLFGGKGHFGNLEVFLILLSGSLFGLAHLGWGPWKVLPTFIHGLMFGYLFIKVGLHATIVMHFLFDYSGFLPEMIGVGDGIQLVFFYSMLVLGGFYLGEIVRGSQIWISKRTSGDLARPVVLLAVHSIASLLLALILVNSGNGEFFVPFLMAVPFMDMGVYLIFNKRTRAALGKAFSLDDGKDRVLLKESLYWTASMICYIASYISLIGSAFGFGWIVSRHRK